MSLLGRKILNLGSRSTKRPARKIPKSFETATSIGVLFSWEDKSKETEVRRFIEAIGTDKNIECLCFNADKKIQPDTSYEVFDHNNLSVLGKIESDVTNRFLNQPFDYLFHLDLELNEMCRALLSRSQAQYRVGLHSEEGENFYELMIGINKSAGLHNFAGQMLKYVTAMK